jgi:SCO1/SenC
MSEIIPLIKQACGDVLMPIMISCDPARDPPEILKDYLGEFHPDIIGLTGTYENVKQTCKAYRVYFSTPEKVKPGEDYMVDHSIYFFLMGKALPLGCLADGARSRRRLCRGSGKELQHERGSSSNHQSRQGLGWLLGRGPAEERERIRPTNSHQRAEMRLAPSILPEDAPRRMFRVSVVEPVGASRGRSSQCSRSSASFSQRGAPIYAWPATDPGRPDHLEFLIVQRGRRFNLQDFREAPPECAGVTRSSIPMQPDPPAATPSS